MVLRIWCCFYQYFIYISKPNHHILQGRQILKKLAATKDKLCDHSYEGLRMTKLIGTEDRSEVGSQGLRVGRNEWFLFKRYIASVSQDKKILEMHKVTIVKYKFT